MDQTFVNGIPVGGKNDPANPRSYPVPKGVLKPGVNEIMIFVRNSGARAAFAGPAEEFATDVCRRPLEAAHERVAIFADRGQCRRPAGSRRGAIRQASRRSTMRWLRRSGSSGSRASPGTRARLTSGSPATIGGSRRWMTNWRQQFGDPRPAIPDRRACRLGQAGVAPGRERLGLPHQRAAARGRARSPDRAGERHRPWRTRRHPPREQTGSRAATGACRASVVYRDGGTVGPLPARAQSGRNGTGSS